MTEIPLLRRTMLAAAALACGALLFRAQLADALVVRGDESLYRARASSALAYYRRALWLDAGSASAVDRFSFVAMTLRDRAALRQSTEFATRYLSIHPEDSVVRFDRAMAYRALGVARNALADFAIVGRRNRDPRAFAFAGYEALRLRDVRRAASFWRAALRLAPNFPAARHGLQRNGLVP